MVSSLAKLAPFQTAFVFNDVEGVFTADPRLPARPWRRWIFGPQ